MFLSFNTLFLAMLFAANLYAAANLLNYSNWIGIVFYLATLAGWRLNQYEKDQTAKAMYNFATIATVFCWYTAAYGWYLNVAIPIWGLLIIFAVVTFVASLASFAVNNIKREKRLVYAVFLT